MYHDSVRIHKEYHISADLKKKIKTIFREICWNINVMTILHRGEGQLYSITLLILEYYMRPPKVITYSIYDP